MSTDVKERPVFSTELCYFLGIVILAFGTAFMERADFGVSMVVAPAYLLHLKLSATLPFFTFGTAEYCLQGVLLLLIALCVGRFKRYYFFSFVTAVLYGFTLDGSMWLVARFPDFGSMGWVLYYVVGMLMGALGVSLFFHSYIAPEAYELFVKELSEKFGVDIHRFKTGYDCASCLLSVVMSFAFFGLWHFEGVKLGTAIAAVCNGWIIGRISAAMEKRFAFRDSWKLRKYFE